ncbi:MAG: membrane protein insertion efficiency factor YidD [Candidatus Pacebacteria bacterium]|nr:membrane protein insertion efficiency factor YidD [Candidatus Paceibacterota bacterium]
MKTFFVLLIRIYQFIRPGIDAMQKTIFGYVPQCKHSPTCSDYAISCIEKYGTMRGLFMGLRRILSCR